MSVPWLHQFPIWLTAGLLLILLFLALEIGFRIGLRHYRRREKPGKADQSDLTLASVLALLGLMLAFTYAFSLGRYDLRKQAVMSEANAIGTAFLRADLVPGPVRTELRERLLEYARTRVGTFEAAMSAQDLQQAASRSLAVQAKLWPAVRGLMKSDVPAPVKVSVVQAVNEVLDAHTTRLKVALDRIPSIVFALLVFIAAFSLGVAGYNVALGGQIQRWRMSGFAFILASLMYVITDFDRPLSGFIEVSQFGLTSLVENMESALGN